MGMFFENDDTQNNQAPYLLAKNQDLSISKKYIDLLTIDDNIISLNIYENPLLNASSSLLAILASIPRQGIPKNINKFRQKLIRSINEFRDRALFLDYHPSTVDKACFILCCALDEAILHTEWGERVFWENNSLLSKLFVQRNGGEAFFIILNNALSHPKKLLHFIELQYFLILLGFKGQYRIDEKGELHRIRLTMYKLISDYRAPTLFPVPKKSDLIAAQQPWTMPKNCTVFLCALLSIGALISGSLYWYQLKSQDFIDRYTSFDLNEVIQNRVKWKSDNGIKSVNPISQILSDTNSKQAQSWDIVVAKFSRQDDAKNLLQELLKLNYNAEIQSDGIEYGVYITAISDPNQLKNLIADLNFRFGLNTTIRRAKE